MGGHDRRSSALANPSSGSSHPGATTEAQGDSQHHGVPESSASSRQWSLSDESLSGSGRCLPWPLAAVGLGGLVAAAVTSPTEARLAASQDWPPFVLVTGLLLIGVVANDDGLFGAAGHQLARGSSSGVALFLGASVMVGVVTALLNLDTSVAFLTPVLVYTARSRGGGELPSSMGACSSPTPGHCSYPAPTSPI